MHGNECTRPRPRQLKQGNRINPRPSTLSDTPAGFIYWQADLWSQWGGVLGSKFGNGLACDRALGDATGRVSAIIAGLGSGSEVQHYTYAYDSFGNLASREDTAVNRRETFAYNERRLYILPLSLSRSLPQPK